MKLTKGEVFVLALPFITSFIWLLLLFTFNNPDAFYSFDSEGYLYLAHNLFYHQEFSMGITGTESFIPNLSRTPVYPFFLTILYPITLYPTVIIFIQIILVSISSLLLYKGLLNFKIDKKISKTASILFSLSPSLITFTNQLLSESVFIFLLLLTFYKLSCWSIGKRKIDLILSALFLSLTILCRPIAIFLPVFVFALPASIIDKRKSILFFLTCLLFISPWMIRNKVTFGTYALTNIPSTSLLFQTATIIQTNSGILKSQTYKNKVNELDWTDAASHVQFSNYAWIESLKVIWNNKMTFIKHCSLNCVKFYLQPMRGQLKKQLGNPSVWILNLLILAQFMYLLLITGSFCSALYLVFKRKANWLIVACILLSIYFMLLSCPFEMNARYRIPAIPFLCILGGMQRENRNDSENSGLRTKQKLSL